MKNILFRALNKKGFQPFFEKIHSYSIVMQNYWNGAHFTKSGEIPLIKKVQKKLDENSIVFDVGANNGEYAIEFYKVNGFIKKIYCFEPVKSTFEVLKNSTVKYNQIECVNIGLGEEETEMDIFIKEDGSGLNSIYQGNPLTKYNGTEKIKIRKLTSFANKNNIEKIDFLKIDVEGHELDVLKGGIDMINSEKIKMIQFEMGECNIASRTFFYDFYLLLNEKYNIYRIVPNGLRIINDYSPIREIFACINYFAILKKFDI